MLRSIISAKFKTRNEDLSIKGCEMMRALYLLVKQPEVTCADIAGLKMCVFYLRHDYGLDIDMRYEPHRVSPTQIAKHGVYTLNTPVEVTDVQRKNWWSWA